MEKIEQSRCGEMLNSNTEPKEIEKWLKEIPEITIEQAINAKPDEFLGNIYFCEK